MTPSPHTDVFYQDHYSHSGLDDHLLPISSTSQAEPIFSSQGGSGRSSSRYQSFQQHQPQNTTTAPSSPITTQLHTPYGRMVHQFAELYRLAVAIHALEKSINSTVYQRENSSPGRQRHNNGHPGDFYSSGDVIDDGNYYDYNPLYGDNNYSHSFRDNSKSRDFERPYYRTYQTELVPPLPNSLSEADLLAFDRTTAANNSGKQLQTITPQQLINLYTRHQNIVFQMHTMLFVILVGPLIGLVLTQLLTHSVFLTEGASSSPHLYSTLATTWSSLFITIPEQISVFDLSVDLPPLVTKDGVGFCQFLLSLMSFICYAMYPILTILILSSIDRFYTKTSMYYTKLYSFLYYDQHITNMQSSPRQQDQIGHHSQMAMAQQASPNTPLTHKRYDRHQFSSPVQQR